MDMSTAETFEKQAWENVHILCSLLVSVVVLVSAYADVWGHVG